MLNKYSGYIGFGLLILGMIVGIIGWLKEDSTVAAATKGSVFMMWSGGIMIGLGLIVLAFFGGGKE